MTLFIDPSGDPAHCTACGNPTTWMDRLGRCGGCAAEGRRPDGEDDGDGCEHLHYHVGPMPPALDLRQTTTEARIAHNAITWGYLVVNCRWTTCRACACGGRERC